MEQPPGGSNKVLGRQPISCHLPRYHSTLNTTWTTKLLCAKLRTLNTTWTTKLLCAKLRNSYDVQHDKGDGCLSPDATVQITANTAVAGDYLLPDSKSELAQLDEDDLLITPDHGSSLPDLDNFMISQDYGSPFHRGYWAHDDDTVIISAQMMSSDDLLILSHETVVPPSPSSDDNYTPMQTNKTEVPSISGKSR
jgi:hypothetical protein